MTALETFQGGNTTYLSIVGGKIAQKVSEDTEGAIKREYETSDGVKGHKYELYFKSLSGHIVDLELRDSSFGTQASITLQNDGKNYKISFPANSKYFSSLITKLPNIKFGDDIKISTFEFDGDKINETTKKPYKIRGLSIYQDGEKIDSYYFDKEKEKVINGMPEFKEKEFKKSKWDIYKIQVQEFLEEKVEDLKKEIIKPEVIEPMKGDEISVEDVPF